MESRPNSKKDSDIFIREIEELLFAATTRHQMNIEQEKQWLLQNSSATISTIVKELSVVSFHVLDAIGKFQPINTINISNRAGIPRGTVSKNIKKLTASSLITKVPIPDNRKESVFYLTPLGKELFDLHQELHKQFDLAFYSFLRKYSTEELNFLTRFLKDFQDVTWPEK
jgi:Transcriptional regulators